MQYFALTNKVKIRVFQIILSDPASSNLSDIPSTS